MSEWKPIKTAPKGHGRRFLVYADPRSDMEAAIFTALSFQDGYGDGVRLDDLYGDAREYDILRRVTHWMHNPPIPAKPLTSNKEGTHD